MFGNALNTVLLYSLKVYVLQEEIGGSFKILDKQIAKINLQGKYPKSETLHQCLFKNICSDDRRVYNFWTFSN